MHVNIIWQQRCKTQSETPQPQNSCSTGPEVHQDDETLRLEKSHYVIFSYLEVISNNFIEKK